MFLRLVQLFIEFPRTCSPRSFEIRVNSLDCLGATISWNPICPSAKHASYSPRLASYIPQLTPSHLKPMTSTQSWQQHSHRATFCTPQTHSHLYWSKSAATTPTAPTALLPPINSAMCASSTSQKVSQVLPASSTRWPCHTYSAKQCASASASDQHSSVSGSHLWG